MYYTYLQHGALYVLIQYWIKKTPWFCSAWISSTLVIINKINISCFQEILYLKAFYSRASGKPHKEVLAFLQKAWVKIRDQFEKKSFGIESLIAFNPDFIMEMVKELFKISPTQVLLIFSYINLFVLAHKLCVDSCN